MNTVNPIPSTVPFYMKQESLCLNTLIEECAEYQTKNEAIRQVAHIWIKNLRGQKPELGSLEQFMQHYTLSSAEGLALMCLAEALLRIPDKETRDHIIKDKISNANWSENNQNVSDLLIKASGYGLSVSKATLNSVFRKIGEPFIRTAVEKAIDIMGSQFVLGETIERAISNMQPYEHSGYSVSYDMLGEAARTFEQADIYFNNYMHALKTTQTSDGQNGISVKLSALHPRYEYAQAERCIPDITDKLLALCEQAAKDNTVIIIDAEEVERTELSVAVLDKLCTVQSLRDWDGLGLAVQAYQKRALPLLKELNERAKTYKRIFQTRLVKGAYWDREIKRAQELGLENYPVYTRKCNTDVSYLACAHYMLAHDQAFKPLFGTHNAHTIAAIVEMGQGKSYTLQRLHGMGEQLFENVMKDYEIACDIYAPVGPYEDLLAYLVRRLLENGANSSFVNKVTDDTVDIDDLVRDPIAHAMSYQSVHHDQLPLPKDIYRAEPPEGRLNSKGFDYDFSDHVRHYETLMKKSFQISAPKQSSLPNIEKAVKKANDSFTAWNQRTDRSDILIRVADVFEDDRDTLMRFLITEAKKTPKDAQAEIREAIDFCRYYANQAHGIFKPEGHILHGITGEDNRLYHEGRGVFVCIAPWNFPFAIYTGQIAAALVAGNTVIGKPAEQTPAIGAHATALMHKAGVPKEVLHCIQGDGRIGEALVAHPDIAGVAFTGSTTAAQAINRTLAAKDGAITPLIAETGGLNAMIVDSGALPEQVTDDVILSAFGSAGQRCSALRILCVQDDIADKLIGMIKGATESLVVGDPAALKTDIPPVIDADALKILQDHKAYLDAQAIKIAETPFVSDQTDTFFAPCAYEIASLDIMKNEVFGPILHVYRYQAKDLDTVLNTLNGLGYGLTCGVHSRIDAMHDKVRQTIRAGNIYVNRSMIGAVVGSQPFGGMGLSGTGPKAGGPHYLYAFTTEKAVSVNTTASGGNTVLVSNIE